MPLKRHEVQAYTKKLYRFLKQGHIIRLKKMWWYEGSIDYPTTGYDPVITLDYRLGFLSTLIHEHLHYLHPEWSETTVLKRESILVNSLSERQVKNIIKAIAKVI